MQESTSSRPVVSSSSISFCPSVNKDMKGDFIQQANKTAPYDECLNKLVVTQQGFTMLHIDCC